MALSASLHLRQSQSLVMTPQLMQSIQLLQMTSFELNQFIELEVEKNPLLELTSVHDDPWDLEPSLDQRGADADEPSGLRDTFEASTSGMLSDASTALDGDYENVFPDDDKPVAAGSPDLLEQWKSLPDSHRGAGAGDDYDINDFVAAPVSLRAFVDSQIPFILKGDIERIIGQRLLDLLDDTGYIALDLPAFAAQIGVPTKDVANVLTKLQQLDPSGIFARSLSECLAIQLKARNRLDPAMEKLVNHLDLLARRDFASLKKICGVDEEDLLDMLREIQQLDPKPGSAFQPSPSEAITPDVVVRAAPDGSWLVELNPDALPRVLVNQAYFARISRHTPRNSEDYSFLNDCLQTANWLTRSLDQRARTIMKVASEIVRQQDAFLTKGVAHLRPLNLKTIADAIKMHESTVSRVTSNKYIMTPRGLFELKYFFTVSIGSAGGGESHSAESVRHRIRSLIAQERAEAVLSDDDIVDHLKSEGIDLARRTVAKYREAMNIASSVQRRREKRAMAKASVA
ncbi:RNA polymerase factor sigma-54 [Rhizobium sp. CFBP 8762]|uniref:RNA polymerase factor sigma-54 n=1 Tax=Rhizobium sp. CFBP 8762 TaxID=2775279 RepID=UPI00177E4068|nr:RNA polymerase factor sigma-54 [Rhizobium sp. CFBP 8762]MBD8553702.1 RNA polymerase factor sigma-54 [Rhizobium sp. CFBP 8762]